MVEVSGLPGAEVIPVPLVVFPVLPGVVPLLEPFEGRFANASLLIFWKAELSADGTCSVAAFDAKGGAAT